MSKLRLAKSAISDSVYVGKLKSVNGMSVWSGDKTDVTNDFIGAVISRWNGYEETIVAGDKTYVVSVKEVE
ncbi:DUF7446 family protein [Halalkalibacter krulwichiae]|uniref:Uncharacterized protein n=1 Tax=Halalkalibacter krulwichiae TaxID=199441 RepID=A0A1X9MFF0_9BACI|nr:hypothetical protein [Halalkalibacter krulwichiae]ARK32146.1 hypothetical protein BkAM31D_21135 [Halalkalibacter krulwichiae]